MASKSPIEWTGHTWNPLVGCSVLTPGCTNCYAMRLAKRLGAMGNPLYKGLTKDVNGKSVWTGEMRKAPRHTLLEPLRRKVPTTWFVNSMSDLFHENVPDEWIGEIFAVMALTPQHTYQVLTKRAERMHRYVTERWQPAKALTINFSATDKLNLPAETSGETRRDQVTRAIDGLFDDEPALQKQFRSLHNDAHWTEAGEAKCTQFGWPLPNVWLGVSTEDQKRADERIPWLLRTPAAIRFISAEPLLGPINLRDIPHDLPGEIETWPRLDWVIVGGESGGGYRSMDPDWANDIGWQCKAAGVAFFMKQMAGKKPIPPGMLVREFPKVPA